MEIILDQYTAEVYYKKNDIDFCIELGWNFECFEEDPDDKRIYVYLESSVQWINEYQHPYSPSIEEMKEIKIAIENIVFKDPSRFNIEDWIESNKDFYEELKYEL